MEQQVTRLTNLTTGGPVHVDVRGGRIVRIVPLELVESDGPSWTIAARGREFTPPRRTTLSPFTVAHRSTIYSSRRILTPLRRVDFDPHGERNPQNRGVSGYEPITWDEALDITAGEIERLRREQGPAAMLTSPGSHHLWGNLGYRTSAYYRFMDLVGFTYGEHNPDSWEGWHWGGMHMWGFSWRLGIPEQYDLLEDALQHTELLVFWSSDPESTGGGIYTAFESTPRRYWFKELGVKMIFIDPYFNHTAELFADKWFAPRLGTDVAMGLAIAHVWLAEDLYDKEYVASRTVGFDEWRDYVLGRCDNVPKTPEWAEKECGVPARQIRALAREWGSRKTMLAAGGKGGFGGACRSATGNEWARTMIALAAMQGLGKPGVNIWATTQGVPCDTTFWFPGYNEGGISADTNTMSGVRLAGRLWPEGGPAPNPQHSTEGQTVSRLLLPEAMLHERLEWRGKGFCGSSIESQFQKYEYPAPGYAPCRMYYRYGGSFIGTMTETNRYVRAYREGRIDFVVNQSIWFEGEARFADVILPACTNFERWDIGEWAAPTGAGASSTDACNHRLIVFQQKCIEPLGESKPDYEIFSLLAGRLGIGDLYGQGLTDLEWVRRIFDASDLPARVSWEEFAEKGHYLVPVPPDRPRTPALRWFAEDRVRDTPDLGPKPWDAAGLKGLQTASGKIEFVASSLRRFEEGGAHDPERPVMGPQYIPSWEGHHTPELAGRFPLQLVSPHPRFSFHTMGDGKDSWTDDVPDHRVLIDGHPYWIVRLNAEDAAARGIADGDLVKAFNDRGEVILAAQVTQRVAPGTVHCYESVSDYLPLGEPGHSPDTAGCINILTPKRFVTPTSTGMAPNSCLIQVEKWERKSA
ncbi:MAG TPA: molybdopterin-dependent oxidoreductase [Thermoleophilia bacterium]|nr:molybdopterin-dependent oxidoreductase [Thermoleophilia bacterium]